MPHRSNFFTKFVACSARVQQKGKVNPKSGDIFSSVFKRKGLLKHKFRALVETLERVKYNQRTHFHSFRAALTSPG
jgi:hypothetical protein